VVVTVAQFSAPEVPLTPTRTPDKVLVVGGTGHLGRVFLEQGLAMYGDQVEFRVLARSPKSVPFLLAKKQVDLVASPPRAPDAL